MIEYPDWKFVFLFSALFRDSLEKLSSYRCHMECFVLIKYAQRRSLQITRENFSRYFTQSKVKCQHMCTNLWNNIKILTQQELQLAILNIYPCLVTCCARLYRMIQSGWVEKFIMQDNGLPFAAGQTVFRNKNLNELQFSINHPCSLSNRRRADVWRARNMHR